MGLELRLSQDLRTEQSLSRLQKQELRSLLQLRQELRTVPPPEAAPGLLGIGNAHKLLEKRGLHGVLIGSLAEDIWKTWDPEALMRHKDVDVAVLPDPATDIDIDTFEDGVDWWLPQSGHIRSKADFTSWEGDAQWWENGNGVVIGAGLQLAPHDASRLPPGLHIPTPTWMIDMRISEILARHDHRKVGIDDEVIEALHRRLEKAINPGKIPIDKGVLPLKKFMAYRLQLGIENIPSAIITPVELQDKNLDELSGINDRKSSQL